MAVKDYPEYLKLAVGSILLPDGPERELIIVDYGSTDGVTLPLLNELADIHPEISITKINGIDLVAARNVAISLADGEFIVMHDADDVSLFDRFKIQHQHFLDNPKSQACATRHKVWDNQRGLIIQKPVNWTPYLLKLQFRYGGCPLCHSSLMVRKAVFDNFHYDGNMTLAHDAGLFISLLEAGHNVTVIQKYLVARIQHRGCITKTRRTEQLEYGKKMRRDILGRNVLPDRLGKLYLEVLKNMRRE